MSQRTKKHLDALQQLRAAIRQLSSELSPILSLSDDLDSHFPASELIEIKSDILYTLNSLIFVYLKVKGKDPSKHPIEEELTRTRQCRSKVKKFLGSLNSSSSPPQAKKSRVEND
ncbi:hypothetical protein GEMRC1_001617 [Eukaryota sp. GEM-RC1]